MPLEILRRKKSIELLLRNEGAPAITLQPQTSRGKPEIIPDSEEERHGVFEISQPNKFREVIEISSDESEVERVDVDFNYQTPQAKKSESRPYSQRRIIESSEDESESEVIEISDSSVEIIPPFKRITSETKPTVVNTTQGRPASPRSLVVDESIITFDEPRSARTPLRIASKKKVDESASKGIIQDPSTPKKGKSLASRALLNSFLNVSDAASEVSTRPNSTANAAKPRRNTQKARLTTQLQKLYDYAQQLFADLNESVFKGGLPGDTKLNWNKRLLTTAGKAKYHRSRDGVQTVEIELAEKILTNEERIRNTLSHEMCHLATWIIDKNIHEHHGKLFKSWAARVMKKRPDIDVTVKHNYEISYPYEWKCGKCAKIYGRFSKSIKPEECVCGACKEGTLIPQFEAKRKPNGSKLSRMASTKPQDSPRSIQRPPVVTGDEALESDSESEVIVALTKSLATTYLA